MLSKEQIIERMKENIIKSIKAQDECASIEDDHHIDAFGINMTSVAEAALNALLDSLPTEYTVYPGNVVMESDCYRELLNMKGK